MLFRPAGFGSNPAVHTLVPGEGDIPLSADDSRFANNEAAGIQYLSGGSTVSNLTVTDGGNGGGAASFIFNGAGTIFQCVADSRECVRMAQNGICIIDECYLEATGSGEDHADVIQFYYPDNVDARISNTQIRAHNTAATAGLFWADYTAGKLTLRNVLFNGGPYGCRIHADTGATVHIDFEDVYFVTDSFLYSATFITEVGGTLIVDRWINVVNCTIVDGEIVPGSSIPSP